MNTPKTHLSDLPIYLTLVGGLLMGAVALPFVQADLGVASVGVAVQISLIGGLMLATTGLLFVGLLDFLRPPAARGTKPVSAPDVDDLPLLDADLSAAA